jgi:ABC-2 type transport system ATP-binding protein
MGFHQILDEARQSHRQKAASHIAPFLASDFPCSRPPLGLALMQDAIEAVEVSHRYGDRLALDKLSLAIPSKSIVGLLGPNGSGKSTFFRLLSTLVPIQEGVVRIYGKDVSKELADVRKLIGVVFQSPSLDRKLTSHENIAFQGALLGVRGSTLQRKIAELSKLFRIEEHLHTRVEKLSGGLKRRVELVKGLLHDPQLLLLDEPSTGLDPTSRLELWQAIEQLRREHGTTILLTTHLIDEADKCDRVAILDEGRLAAWDSPENLRIQTGQTVLQVVADRPEEVLPWMESHLSVRGTQVGNSLRFILNDKNIALTDLYRDLSEKCSSVTIGRPSLEDVFIAKTGKAFEFPSIISKAK